MPSSYSVAEYLTDLRAIRSTGSATASLFSLPILKAATITPDPHQ
jgi:hypothetical protein